MEDIVIMKKLVVISILFVNLAVYAQSPIEGIWDINENAPRTHQIDFSWGKSLVSFAQSIVIDLRNEPPAFTFIPDVADFIFIAADHQDTPHRLIDFFGDIRRSSRFRGHRPQ